MNDNIARAQEKHRQTLEQLGGKIATRLARMPYAASDPDGVVVTMETLERSQLFGWNLRTLVGAGIQLRGWDASSNLSLGDWHRLALALEEAAKYD